MTSLPPVFDQLLQSAIAYPEQANVLVILQEFDRYLERYIAQLTRQEKLDLVGTMMVKLAELHETRAHCFLKTWEEAHQDPSSQDLYAEPILTDDLLIGLLRQSMTLAIDDLFEEVPPSLRNRHVLEGEQDDSIAANVEKSAVLEMVDELEKAVHHDALAIAHDEDILAWNTTILNSLRDLSTVSNRDKINFCDLCETLHQQDSRMSWVKIWLGLLLGGYQLEQDGNFYEPCAIWISLPSSVPDRRLGRAESQQ